MQPRWKQKYNFRLLILKLVKLPFYDDQIIIPTDNQ